ncbi:type II secretion system F family protein [Thiomicrorhabdus sp.]|uniref:type II secretion system F family protein n=1 Tax=Thiomicrorhabdus sp. TaxID=2039724 RepID=UPI0029C7F8EC|nr:type II secretion system F family protein [Thiomicrorhabdus sp.]
MDWAFVGIAVAIGLPFLILSLGMAWGRRYERSRLLSVMKRRVGLEPNEVLSFKEQLLQQQQSPWFIWVSDKFKQAGIVDKKQTIRMLILEAVLILVAFALLIKQLQADQLDGNSLFLAVILPILPIIYLYVKINQRQTELRSQFPEMLEAIVRSLNSGYGVDGAIGALGQDMTGPLAEEMREVHKQLALGISMREVLREFQRRVDLPEAQFFVMTLIIQRETGGQLSNILRELARLMRRREVFQNKLKTLTAESRMTAWFIGGAPVLYVAYKFLFDRPSLHFFLNDPLGIQLFAISFALIFTGALILRYMLRLRF